MKLTMRVAILTLLVSAAICGYFFAREYKTAQEEVSEYSNLQNAHTIINSPISDSGNDDIADKEPCETDGLPYTEVDFEALLLINPDTVGWIAIPDTNISYPVVQTTNNTKYLSISFEGSQSKAGTLFVNKDNNMQALDSNTIIYGHNMGAGRSDMFNSLLMYKSNGFYSSHRCIQFDTINQNHGWWKVFAVIELDTQSSNYIYQQREFQTDAEFMRWTLTAKALSMHESDVEISPTDRILTLSTCDRSGYGQHGRLLILAVRLRDIMSTSEEVN